MKKVRLVLVAVVAMLLLGMSSVSGQEKSTVIITGETDIMRSKYKIEIIKPDYEVENKISKNKDDNFFVSIKKETDFWLGQGYKIIEVTSNLVGTSFERVLFVLIKEE